MKNTITIFLLMFAAACNTAQTNFVLSAADFKLKIDETKNAQLIDVRTSDEFNDGHLANALNYDWNGTDFEKQISALDKNNPVFVYCLSGKRSAAAATQMRSEGFKEVYELDGGIMKWRAAKLPETQKETLTQTSVEMSIDDFKAILNTDKTILIDVNATWCGPCQIMKPYVEEIKNELASTVTVITIDADQNKLICDYLKVDALPTLLVYKNQKLKWRNVGLISKEEIEKHL